MLSFFRMVATEGNNVIIPPDDAGAGAGAATGTGTGTGVGVARIGVWVTADTGATGF